jgi:hypothetical protein
LAGKTVTVSFYGKAGANYSAASGALTYALYQGTGIDQNVFGMTGGSGVGTGTATLTTSWQRFSFTVAVPSTSTELAVYFSTTPVGTAGANDWFEITGVQLEEGSTATPFSRAGGTIQGELAACQRYYFRTQVGNSGSTPYMGVTVAGSATTTYANLIHKVTMRSAPTSVEFSSIKWQAINNSGNISAASLQDATPENTLFVCTTTGATAGVMNYVIGQTTAGYMAVSAEL